jgi:cytochrome c-type biogenesis protein CcmF
LRADGPGGTHVLTPQKRNYAAHHQPTTEASIHTTWRADLYAVLGEPVGTDTWQMRLFLNPLVVWIWWGLALMIAGVMLALLQGRARSA